MPPIKSPPSFTSMLRSLSAFNLAPLSLPSAPCRDGAVSAVKCSAPPGKLLGRLICAKTLGFVCTSEPVMYQGVSGERGEGAYLSHPIKAKWTDNECKKESRKWSEGNGGDEMVSSYSLPAVCVNEKMYRLSVRATEVNRLYWINSAYLFIIYILYINWCFKYMFEFKRANWDEWIVQFQHHAMEELRCGGREWEASETVIMCASEWQMGSR